MSKIVPRVLYIREHYNRDINQEQHAWIFPTGVPSDILYQFIKRCAGFPVYFDIDAGVPSSRVAPSVRALSTGHNPMMLTDSEH